MMTTPVATPKWMIAIIIVAVIPVMQLPWLLDACQAASQGRTLVWLYPFYAIIAGYLAYLSYPNRPVISWILIVLMVLSHIAIHMLVNMPATASIPMQ